MSFINTQPHFPVSTKCTSNLLQGQSASIFHYDIHTNATVPTTVITNYIIATQVSLIIIIIIIMYYAYSTFYSYFAC